jgi:hypothetical protein
MQKKLMNLLIGVLFFLMLPLLMIALPANALAAAKAPVTSLQTNPHSPKGENNWFTAAITIKFETTQDSTIFYQWNTTEGKWSQYKAPFRAWRGENTIYYYSVNRHGQKEAIKSRTIKVNYIKPEKIEGLTAASVKEQASLTWDKNPDAVSYLVYKQKKGDYGLIAQVSTTAFVDTNVLVGRNYYYAIKSVNAAGLKSELKTVRVGIQKYIPPVEPIKVKTIIGTGISTSSLAQKSVVAEPQKIVETPVKNEPIETKEKEQPVKNWNRLLVAISILVIAVGAAIGGYYGYEWWLARREEDDKPKDKKSNRW